MINKAYRNKSAQIALVTHLSKKNEVTFVTFEGNNKMSLEQFKKDFTIIETNVAKLAAKMLNNKFLTLNQNVIKSLKEIVMSQSYIITVTEQARFINRFFDQQTAKDLSPDNSIIIQSAEDFESKQFSKRQLLSALKDLTEEQTQALKEYELDKTSKRELALQLFSKYASVEIEVKEAERKQRKQSAPEDKKPRERSLKDKLRDLFNDNRILSQQNIIDEIYKPAGYDVTPFTVNTAINNLKSDKHCGKEGVLDIISGIKNGVRVYFLSTVKVDLDTKTQTRKQKTKVTAQNINEDEEIDNSNEQMSFDL